MDSLQLDWSESCPDMLEFDTDLLLDLRGLELDCI